MTPQDLIKQWRGYDFPHKKSDWEEGFIHALQTAANELTDLFKWNGQDFPFTLKERWGDGVMEIKIPARDYDSALTKLQTLLTPDCPWELL